MCSSLTFRPSIEQTSSSKDVGYDDASEYDRWPSDDVGFWVSCMWSLNGIITEAILWFF